jgi:hypothetical protein
MAYSSMPMAPSRRRRCGPYLPARQQTNKQTNNDKIDDKRKKERKKQLRDDLRASATSQAGMKNKK